MKNNTFLFLGFTHRVNDSRLFHRQMRMLKKECPDCKIYFATYFDIYDLTDCFDDRGEINKQHSKMVTERYTNKESTASNKILFWLRKYLLRFASFPMMAWKIYKVNPSVVQASDIREILWALLLRIITCARIIYDAHEDYFNQIYEYSGKSIFSLFHAYFLSFVEVVSLRYFDALFGTDDYVVEKYSRKVYRTRNSNLLRNFPTVCDAPFKESHLTRSKLDLVYVGSVNMFRGVVECAQYVQSFNAEKLSGVTLSFTVYSPKNSIVDALVQQGLIIHKHWTDYADLKRELAGYDIGICLLHPLEKYKRNLPTKNFDYMAAGLPIITSNFGNLQWYAKQSEAALCINPFSYDEFKSGILELMDLDIRQTLGKNGRAYVESQANFEEESKRYVSVMIDK